MIKRGEILVLFLFILIFISGCVKEIECKEPYMKEGVICCLDENSNLICDKHEKANESNEEIKNGGIKEVVVQEEIVEVKVGGIYPKEMKDFIKPEETSEFLEQIKEKLTDDSKTDIVIITKELDAEVDCPICSSISCKDLWNTPAKTLGKSNTEIDCEDYGITLLSIIKRYNPRLMCQNIIVTGNKGGGITSQYLATYCKEGSWNYIASCESRKSEIITIKDNFKYKEFVNSHLINSGYYSIKEDEKVIVFDEEWYTIYNNLDRFTDWMIDL